MDNSAEVREFLTTRRAKVSPADAGLPVVGQRRVAGLRRAEVASLAEISVEHYAKLERGAIAGVSASVLEGLARALQMDDAERTHLFDLAQTADGTAALARPRRRSTGRWAPRPGLQWALDAITASPAIVRTGRMDLLATNTLGWAMHSSLYEAAATTSGSSTAPAPPNFARYTFLDEDARRFYPDWDTAAATAVAILRTEAGRAPHDKTRRASSAMDTAPRATASPLALPMRTPRVTGDFASMTVLSRRLLQRHAVVARARPTRDR